MVSILNSNLRGCVRISKLFLRTIVLLGTVLVTSMLFCCLIYQMSNIVLFLFGTEGKSLRLGDNVKLSSWLPQNDILGHPKTRLFIGHAGMNGMLEAAYHGVPMICVPFFADQFDNSVAAKHFGMAEILHKESITEESLVTLISTVLNNSR